MPTKEIHGIAVASMDTSNPADDSFYDYANGTWIKKNGNPSDYSRVDVLTALLTSE